MDDKGRPSAGRQAIVALLNVVSAIALVMVAPFAVNELNDSPPSYTAWLSGHPMWSLVGAIALGLAATWGLQRTNAGTWYNRPSHLNGSHKQSETEPSSAELTKPAQDVRVVSRSDSATQPTPAPLARVWRAPPRNPFFVGRQADISSHG